MKLEHCSPRTSHMLRHQAVPQVVSLTLTPVAAPVDVAVAVEVVKGGVNLVLVTAGVMVARTADQKVVPNNLNFHAP